MKPTVVIAERSEELAAALRDRLTQAGCQVVAMCHDGVATVRQTKQLRPQFLLLDDYLPPLTYGEVADTLARMGVTVTILPTAEATASALGLGEVRHVA